MSIGVFVAVGCSSRLIFDLSAAALALMLTLALAERHVVGTRAMKRSVSRAHRRGVALLVHGCAGIGSPGGITLT